MKNGWTEAEYIDFVNHLTLQELEAEGKPKKVMIVDPPAGWKYGFPAILQNDYKQQLLDAEYPAKDIDIAIRYSRYWYQ